ncbi:MAG: GAF domain-containing protein [Caldimonas sp.]
MATLRAGDISSLADALASADPRARLLAAVDDIAAARLQVTIFSASICLPEVMELQRIYSSRPDVYPLGMRKNKQGTSWAEQVLRRRKVFVGEGPLEMAAAFDDQQRMASVGIRSIINVPIVVGDRCLGVLNFARAVERVSSAEIVVARFLGVAASAAFVDAAG